MRPARGATFTASGSFSAGIFQSTRPVRGATRLQRGEITGDQAFQSTRPVRGATLKPITANMIVEFQSTRPVRGATIASWPKRPNKADFNPRAPCGARQTGKKEGTTPKKFQSTRPVRGATRPGFPRYVRHQISIHAPRAGRDSRPAWTCPASTNFNPRAPCGARR